MTPFNSKYKTTQAFGVNAEYYKKFGLAGHEGIDLIPTGSVWDVYSLTDGVVVNETDDPRSGAYGIWLTVWCPTKDIALQYCHLKENYVKAGDKITKGQKIGVMGSTGNSTGPHLHLNLFAVDDNGVRLNRNNGYNGGINPLPLLETEDVEVPNTQAELDKLREQRDDNWNLYTESQKELEQARKTLQELNVEYEGIKQELTSYKAIVRTYADLLGVGPTETEKIAGEIKKLIELEDINEALLRDLSTTNDEYEQLQKTNEALKKDYNLVNQEKETSRQALEVCIADKKHKALTEYTKLERLLSLFR